MPQKYVYAGKKQLVQETANATGFPIKYCAEIITEFIEVVKDNLVDGRRVNVPNFGVFIQKLRHGQYFLNRGEPFYVQPRFRIYFKPADNFKKILTHKTADMIKITDTDPKLGNGTMKKKPEGE